MKTLYSILILIFFCSCNNEEKENSSETKDKTTKTKELESPNDNNEINESQLSLELEEFTNVEQVEFCILLPLKNYKLMESKSEARAQFYFENPKDSNNYIQLKGLFRSDPSVSIEEYFKNTYSSEQTEEQGKMIIDKELIKDKNVFWARGYYSNSSNQPFLEITWLRKDDVVTFFWNFRLEESNYQLKVLNFLIKTGVGCEL